jgi:hypothetical protein
MAVIEIYKNEILSKNGQLRATILTVPSRSFNNSELLTTHHIIENLRGTEKLIQVRAADLWEKMKGVLFFEEMASHSLSDISTDEFLPSGGLQFSEDIVFGKHVIFENSPLSMESIAGLVQKATGVGIGAYVGFLVGGNSFLLLLTVPAGIVICGSAAGVAQALEADLKERILKMLVRVEKLEGKQENKKEAIRKVRIEKKQS